LADAAPAIRGRRAPRARPLQLGTYFREEFGASSGQGYRLLRAARVEIEVSVHADTHGMREAQARVLVPLAETARAEVVQRVADEGGFAEVTVARIEEVRDEVLGLRRVSAGKLVWDERALRGAAFAGVRVGGLSRAFADVDALRHLPPEDAARVHEGGGERSASNVRNRVLAPAVERASEALIEAGSDPLPEGLTPHGLRRTFVSILCARGVDLPVAMRQAGHAGRR
jgi:hypothetical protein